MAQFVSGGSSRKYSYYLPFEVFRTATFFVVGFLAGCFFAEVLVAVDVFPTVVFFLVAFGFLTATFFPEVFTVSFTTFFAGVFFPLSSFFAVAFFLGFLTFTS